MRGRARGDGDGNWVVAQAAFAFPQPNQPASGRSVSSTFLLRLGLNSADIQKPQRGVRVCFAIIITPVVLPKPYKKEVVLFLPFQTGLTRCRLVPEANEFPLKRRTRGRRSPARERDSAANLGRRRFNALTLDSRLLIKK